MRGELGPLQRSVRSIAPFRSSPSAGTSAAITGTSQPAPPSAASTAASHAA